MNHLTYTRFNGFCGIANLANILRDETILQYLNDEKFIPCDHRKMTKILNEIGWPENLVIEPMIQLPNGLKVSNDMAKELIMSDLWKIDDKSFVPFILNVRLRESDKYSHSVSVLRFNDYLLYSDPIKPEYIKLSNIDELFDHFEIMIGVWAFQLVSQDGSDDQFCALNLRHLFN